MKKRFLTLLLSSLAAVSLSSCKGTYTEVDYKGAGYADNDYFALNRLLYNVGVGESKSLEIDSFPEAYAQNSIEFSSSNPSVATVDEKGVITGVALGIADVSVKAKDGSFEQKARIVVSKSSSKKGSSSIIKSITDKYNDPSYKSPTKVVRYEYSEEFYNCEGVRDHGMASFEAMGFNFETGYFFVEGPSVYYKTQHGAPEVMDGKWIFYPINQGIYTRLVHITPTAKNYYDFNTSEYESNAAIIKDIMNFFFVSGEKIVNDLMADYDGKEDFVDFSGYDSTSFYSVNNDSLFLNYKENAKDQVVGYDDEINYFDIPTDTVYSYTYEQSLINSSNRCKALDVRMKMSYKLDGKNWEREFNRSQLFDADFEEFKIPKDAKENGYQEVDSIYDL